jgi:pectate lyase
MSKFSNYLFLRKRDVIRFLLPLILFSIGTQLSLGQTITKSSGWLESAFVEWSPVSGADSYNVYYTGGGQTNKKIDTQLIRSYGTYFRADIPGLAAGTYTIKVAPVIAAVEGTGSITSSLTVLAHDRTGFAFHGGRVPGGYKADGTPKTGAVILYITQNTKNTISMNITGATTNPCVGLQNILYAIKKGNDTRPFIIRLIGNITDMSVMEGGDITIENANNPSSYLTIEGVGDDAVVNGMGIRLKSASNIEVSNLGFMNCDSTAGDNVGMQQDNDHIWVHNCDLFYGNAGSDADQIKGDGAMDNKSSTYVTLSYNHFWDNGKSSLLGLSENTTVGLYITYHHNWFDHSDSRHPRVRFYSAHIYNNYFDGNSKYGSGSTLGSSLFVEGNYYRNSSNPMLTSLQGTDIWDETNQVNNAGTMGTFSGEAGGTIKAFNNTFDVDNGTNSMRFVAYGDPNPLYNIAGKISSTSDFDAYLATSRGENVPSSVVSKSGGNTYNNFDTDAALYVKNLIVDTPAIAKDKVMQYAGRVSGGDLKWSFTPADDTSYLVIPSLKTELTNYVGSLVSVQGESTPTGSQTLTSTTNNNQTVASGTAIGTIVFTWGGVATDATVTGLPVSGISFEKDATAKTITISGTPTANVSYSIVTSGSSGTSATGSGTITVSTASTGDEIHNFSVSGKTSSFYTITGTMNSVAGSESYDGLQLTARLKMETATSITYTTTGTSTLTLVFDTGFVGTVKLNNVSYTAVNGVVVIPSIPAGANTIAKGTTTNLFYIKTVYDGGNPTTTPQTITFDALTPVTYGDTAFDLTATASSALAVSYASSNTAVATISGNTVTILGAGSTNITASQAGNSSYTAATDVVQALVVNEKNLTVASALAQSKAYDGNNAATITGTLSGIINSDDVSLVLSGTFADATPGTEKVVTSTATLTGSKATNYVLIQPTGLTADITIPAPNATSQTFCGTATVADLVATGTSLKWYTVADGGSALNAATELTSGTYYVSQTLAGVEGTTRTSVAVTINPLTTTGSVAQSQCGGTYTWPVNGVTYSASTAQTVITGCNTATLNLTITPATTTGSVTTSVACGSSYTWPANGVTYTTAQSGVTVISGCNTATLNLTITPTTTGSVTTSINAGASYTWPANGLVYTTAQTNLTYTVGCNTATLNLSINTPSLKTDVWDFGATQLDASLYNNMLTVTSLNSVLPGTAGSAATTNLVGNTTFTSGVLTWTGTGDRLRTTNTSITRYDANIASVPDATTFRGRLYANGTVTVTNGLPTSKYLTMTLAEDDEVTLISRCDTAPGTLTFVLVSNYLAQKDTYSTTATSGATSEVKFVAKTAGAYRIYDATNKASFFRIYRKAATYTTITGTMDVTEAPDLPSTYSILFTNPAGKVWTASVTSGSYSVTLPAGYTYTMSLSNATGYIITNGDSLAVTSSTTTYNVTLQKAGLFAVSGAVTGLGTDISKVTLVYTPSTTKVYVPKPVINTANATYTVSLEPDTQYTVSALGVNDYQIPSNTITITGATTAAVDFTLKTKYGVTINTTGLTTAQSNSLTLTFTNLNESGYVYTFAPGAAISLRNGTYAITYSGLDAYPVELGLLSNLTVNGSSVSKTLAFKPVTTWSFEDKTISTSTTSYKGMLFGGTAGTISNQIASGHLVAKSGGTIKIPVTVGDKISVSYYYTANFSIEGGAAITTATNSTNILENVEYTYDAATAVNPGFVTISLGGVANYTTYLTEIKIGGTTAYTSEITVGTDKNYQTINAALDAISKMVRTSGQRVTVLIDPGNYEEMVEITQPNITFKNAATTPNINLLNNGVDIAAGAVRITSYYGHGYNYYSMSNDQKWHSDVLSVNKENGYLSYQNTGAGTTNNSYWNATLIVGANGFQAENIIIENSFNQYISKKESEDVLVMWASGSKGLRPTTIGSTAVQDKSFVERAAAIAVKNNIDKVILNKCRVVGRQDSFYGGTGARVVVNKGVMMGATDYIFGGMNAVFYKTDLAMNTSDGSIDISYITAAQQSSGRGYLMYECKVTTAIPGTETASVYRSKPGYFGRPWATATSEVVFYNTTVETSNYTGFEGQSLIMPLGWLNTLGGESTKMYEYGSIENSGVNNSSSRATWATKLAVPILTYGTPITTFNFTKGSDNWDPLPQLIADEISAPTANNQTFCGSATVADLVATGTSIKWYSAASGDSALDAAVNLITGTSYYASQTIEGIEGTARKSVVVTITPTTTTGSESVSACGSSYTWALNGQTYTTSGAYEYVTGCNTATLNLTLTPNTTNGSVTLTQKGSYTWPANGLTYTSSTTQTVVSGCNTATLNLTINTSEIPTGSLVFCKGATVATAVGSTTLKFYTASTGGAPLLGTTALTTKTFFVTETINSVESASRTAVSVIVNNLPAIPGTVTSIDAKLICKYIGTTNPVTFTATGGSSYNWTVPEGASIVSGSGTGTIGVSFEGVSTTPGVIGAVTARAVDNNGCISALKALTLTTKAPTAPTALVLSNSEILSGVAIKKVGPYIGTNTVFTLTAPAAVSADHYRWDLPAGVNQLSGGTSNSITIDFADVVQGVGSLPISVFSVGGCAESTARTLTLARALPTAPTKLVLTESATIVTRVGAYTSKTTSLTLTATPFTTQGATATSFTWVLPSGVNVVSGATEKADNGTTKTYSGTANVLSINLGGVGIGVLSIPMSVYAVNGTGSSAIPRTLTVTSAAPATPGTITVTGYNPCNSSFTAQVTHVPGVEYSWSVSTGTIIAGQGTNSITITPGLATAVTISVVGSNGTGSSATRILSTKKSSTPCKLDTTEVVTDAFNVIVYPNPTSDEFTIESSRKGANVQVYDLAGRLIENRQISSKTVQVGRNYAAGVYNVIARQGSKVITLKVIKK